MDEQINEEILEEHRPTFTLPDYPRSLPELDISPKTDENGFSALEKAALRNAWRFIQPFQRRYGQKTFYDFLTENEMLIDSFRQNGKINLRKLHGHANAMMRLLSKLVQSLDMSLQFHSSLDENLPLHLKNKINTDDMKKLANALKDYLLACPVIEKHNSCTLTTALEKLVIIVGEYAEVDAARRIAMSGFYRSTIDRKTERASSTIGSIANP